MKPAHPKHQPNPFHSVSDSFHNQPTIVSAQLAPPTNLLHVFPNLTEQRVAKTDRYGLGLDVVLERGLAELAADTRLLVAAEG